MENSQLKWISFGVLSLFGLGYYYRKFNEQQQEYKRKVLEFRQVYKESESYMNKSLTEIMNTKKNQSSAKEMNVCFVNLKPNYTKDTFKLFERERSIFDEGPRYASSDILQNQMGGEFIATRNDKQKIRCKLNDFNLSGALLKEEKKNVNLFKDLNKLQPIVCSVTTTLGSMASIAIYGKLYYDNSKLQWAIEPFFLTGGFNLSNVIQKFYSDKLGIVTLYKFAIIFGGMALAYFTLAKPLTSFIKRKRLQNAQRVFENDLDYFKSKDYIKVKGDSLLNCQACKTKSVEIIYECGHLALCLSCHDKNETKQCPICTKISTKFMKIFMA